MRSNMIHTYRDGCLLLATMLMVSIEVLPNAHAVHFIEQNLKYAVFLTPMIELRPGMVADRYFYDIPFPRGHIAVKSFSGELVDETGNPIPLHETYLHHWLVRKYYQLKDKNPMDDGARFLHHSNRIMVRNSGVCQELINGQYFGLGSETRKTANYIADPYGIEVGNPTEVPPGYEERWMINLHAIDTRGVTDRSGCIECRCELYNVTLDEHGLPLPPGYVGGVHCCYDGTQCKKQRGFQGTMRTLHLRYTVKWIDWSIFVVPLKIYILDVTDNVRRLNNSTPESLEHDCEVEYHIESSCSGVDKVVNDCIHVKRNSIPLAKGGYVIYGVAHQHAGGVGLDVYGQDGRVICSSAPIYGEGYEVGNEKGYVVGMSTCYPEPGSVKIEAGEMLTLESNYSSTHRHSGLMGIIYLLIAEQLPHNTHSSLYSYFQSLKDILY